MADIADKENIDKLTQARAGTSAGDFVESLSKMKYSDENLHKEFINESLDRLTTVTAVTVIYLNII